MALNATHDPKLKSWLDSANQPDSDFPIQNLPFGIFRRKSSTETFRGGVAIGDQIIDLAKLAQANLFEGTAQSALNACTTTTLNDFMALGKNSWHQLRVALSEALTIGSQRQAAIESCLVAQVDADYSLPAHIGDYTDFYSSIYHATKVGSLFRPDNPLLPNYKWVPIGYHGRASSIVISGTECRRPWGQTKAPDAVEPSFSPCKRLDYEMELGLFVGPGNGLGNSISIDEAADHLFGITLLNDWSARDIQAWEYQPLGPFLSKSFNSVISPWIVTAEALEPFRTPWTRPKDDPSPLAYLDNEFTRKSGAIDIQVEVFIQTQTMRSDANATERLSHSSFKHSYWTAEQLITHHSVNGCNLNPGDLLGSGTQSGPHAEEAGCLLELSNGGKNPITLKNGETRTFLEDGDQIIMTGYCEKPGATRIGFGTARSTIVAAETR